MFGKNNDLKTEVVTPKEEETPVNNVSSSSPKKVGLGDVFKNLMQNKMMRYMILLIGFIVVFLIIMFLITLVFPKKYDYGDVETIMENAAKSYFTNDPSMLPQEEMGQVSISAERLEELNYMKPLDKYLSGSCNGNVTVTKNNSNYNYVGYLDCGNEYVTQELYKKIVEPGNIVTSGYGIYNINNEFVFRGEIVKNYISVDDVLYRIVKVNSKNETVLILNEPIKEEDAWDDRYNNEVLYKAGINNYSVSRIKDYLTRIYKNGSKETVNYSDLTRQRMAPFSACIGARGADDTSKDNSTECAQTLTNQYISLLTAADYINASTDTNCQKTIDKTCGNYNYLVLKNEWWLLTPNSANTYEVYESNYDGNVGLATADEYARIRPVIHLGPTAKYAGGKGTEKNPYKFR